ncbi:MAG: mannosyltransferase family protein [Chloroflexota bacterium]
MTVRGLKIPELRSAPLARWRWLWIPLAAFLVSRLLIFGAGIVGDTMMPTEEGHWLADADSPFLSQWTKWDSQYYVDIATNGYWFRPQRQSNVAFFPLYPMLMRVLGPYVGGVIPAGFLVSNLALLGGLIFLYLLAELETSAASAERSVFYLALFPTAFFFSCVYTESLFLLLTVGAMYFARRRAWIPAALLGLLASATRNLGVLTWALVMWEWLRAQGWKLTRIHTRAMWLALWSGLRKNWIEVLVIAIIPLGMIAYVVFLKQNFDRPLAFIETQAAWGRQNIGPVAVIQKSLASLAAGQVNKGWLTQLWNTTTLLLFLLSVPLIWWKLGEGYAIYVLIMLLVPASSATGSVIRYVLTAYPAFIVLGDLIKPAWLDRAITAAWAVLLGLFVVLFVNWIFVA